MHFFCKLVVTGSPPAAARAVQDMLDVAVKVQGMTDAEWLPALLVLCARRQWDLAQHVIRKHLPQPTPSFTGEFVHGLFDVDQDVSDCTVLAALTRAQNWLSKAQLLEAMRAVDICGRTPLLRSIQLNSEPLCRSATSQHTSSASAPLQLQCFWHLEACTALLALQGHSLQHEQRSFARQCWHLLHEH